MLQRQKETVLALLKSDEVKKTFGNKYWLAYKDFLNPLDDFTAFSCENGEGKQDYIDLIENLLSIDETAEIFVEVYGYEEDNNEQFIYADTLIIFSKLSLFEIKQIFNEPQDIFPSDIREITDFSQQNFIIDENGDLLSVENPVTDNCSAYYCWWD